MPWSAMVGEVIMISCRGVLQQWPWRHCKHRTLQLDQIMIMIEKLGACRVMQAMQAMQAIM